MDWIAWCLYDIGPGWLHYYFESWQLSKRGCQIAIPWRGPIANALLHQTSGVIYFCQSRTRVKRHNSLRNTIAHANPIACAGVHITLGKTNCSLCDSFNGLIPHNRNRSVIMLRANLVSIETPSQNAMLFNPNDQITTSFGIRNSLTVAFPHPFIFAPDRYLIVENPQWLRRADVEQQVRHTGGRLGIAAPHPGSFLRPVHTWVNY